MRLDEYRKQILDVPAIHALPPELKSRVAMILLWIAHEAEVVKDEVIYSQGAEDEDTGCVLVAGAVQISKAGETIKECAAPEILRRNEAIHRGKSAHRHRACDSRCHNSHVLLEGLGRPKRNRFFG